MTIVQAVILGLVQGIGEFLPISSSAHLILIPWFFGWGASGIEFDLALHMGTLAAVTLYFWRDLLGLAVEGLTKGTRTPMGRMAWGVVAGTIPGAAAGFLFEDKIDALFRTNYLLMGILLAVMGAILYLVDRRSPKNRSLEDFKVIDGFWMGIGQAFALIPGFSRSGTSITAGLLTGLNREAAAKASFLLGWPIILGGGLLHLKDLDPSVLTSSFYTGVLVSAVSGYLVIAFLMDYLRRGTFFVFAAYRAVLAAITIFFAVSR
ncbi:MAG TPA: undecaprenyl-diphosphate phosphatase [Symbiobacteriaceae bacterium]|nr:undecaprenyl-diphosphate phosphatase [Symbiobacteriaceae bacterium]